MIWVYFEFEFVSKKHFKNLISSLIGANSHFFLGPQKGMYSFSTKISSLVDLSIFSLLPLAYKHLSITRNLWKRCSDLNRTVHLLNVSFSLCESALLRYFELLVHPQPTTLSISTIVRPIGWNVLILSVSVQSNVLRRFRRFEYLFDLDIGLLEHWLFGRWLRLTINIWSKKNIKCNKMYHKLCFLKINTYTKDPSEKKCFSGMVTTWQCLRHLFLELASVNLTTNINMNVIIFFIIFFQDYKKISNFSYKWFCQFSCLNMTEQHQIALIDSW